MSQTQAAVFRFHIVWLTGKTTEAGTSLSSGITIPAHSMLEALAEFHRDIAQTEPIYILNLDADIPLVGTNK